MACARGKGRPSSARRTAVAALLGLGGAACSDDASGGGSASSTGTTGGAMAGDAPDGAPDDAPDDGGDTSPPGATSTAADASDDAVDTTGAPTDGDASDGDSTGAAPVDCDALPRGPFTAVEPWRPQPFIGSEDLAFDGLGNLAGKSGDTVRLIDGDGTETAVLDDMGDAYGLRYRQSGTLLVAHFMSGEIAEIEPDGTHTVFADNLPGVNGLYPDLEGRVWLTDFFTVQRIEADGTVQQIVSGGDSATANGIVYDPDRGFAFFTNYGQGRIRKVAIDEAGAPGAVTDVATIDTASPDGLVLDECGNLYVVDQGESRLYRVMLDGVAEAVESPEDLLGGPLGANVANAQFGRGEGFDPRSLYAAGTPGVVYQVELGVGGAPIPLPSR